MLLSVFAVKRCCTRSLREQAIKRLWRSSKKPCAIEEQIELASMIASSGAVVKWSRVSARDSFSNLLARVYRRRLRTARRSRDRFVCNTRCACTSLHHGVEILHGKNDFAEVLKNSTRHRSEDKIWTIKQG